MSVGIGMGRGTGLGPRWCAIAVVLLALGQTMYAFGAGYTMTRDIAYRAADEAADASFSRCRLDVYAPSSETGFATIVWFHAGGLTSGERWIPEGFKDQGIAVVAVDYRLSPGAVAPAYIEDAAAAVAWTLANIGEHGGDPARVFVAGHSAGAYLASMIAMDRRYLERFDATPHRLAGTIAISGHTATHFTVRAERGVPGTTTVIDELAPLHHVRADAPPMLLITGDRERELLGRYEENAFFWRMMRVVGHPDCELLELDGFDHGGVVGPAQPLALDFVRRVSGEGG